MQYIDLVLKCVLRIVLLVFLIKMVLEMRKDGIKLYSFLQESKDSAISFMRVASAIALFVWYKTGIAFINIVFSPEYQPSTLSAWLDLRLAFFIASGVFAFAPKAIQKLFEVIGNVVGAVVSNKYINGNSNSNSSNNDSGGDYE